jgi:hypothetical protein
MKRVTTLRAMDSRTHQGYWQCCHLGWPSRIKSERESHQVSPPSVRYVYAATSKESL